MITPQSVQRLLLIKQSGDLNNKDGTLFSGGKIVFSQSKSKCKCWILNLGNKLQKTRTGFHWQNFPNQAHMFFLLNLDMIKNEKTKQTTLKPQGYFSLSCLVYHDESSQFSLWELYESLGS